MIKDLNKKIEDVQYNHLNLPEQIEIAGERGSDFIYYTYDAAGIKLRKTAGSTTTDYVGNFIYIDGMLQYMLTDYGKINVNITKFGDTILTRQYNITDHLGNTRVTFEVNNTTGAADIIQEDSYYPYGMTMNGLNYLTVDEENKNKYLYNGKELQSDEFGPGQGLDWYDYGARFYDAQLGRWHVVDPRAEDYYALSPYNYVANNPIKLIDPNGEEIIVIGDGEYRSQVYLALIKLASTQAGFDKLYNTISSENKLVIQKGSGRNEVYGDQPHGDGTRRSYLDLDLNKVGGENPDGSVSTVETLLAHEFDHFLNTDPKRSEDIAFKNWKDSESYGGVATESFNYSEVSAVEAGNEIRATYGDKLRTEYAGVNVYNKVLSKYPRAFKNNGMTAVYKYYTLVPGKNKFDANKHKGKFTSRKVFSAFANKVKKDRVKVGDYKNSRTHRNNSSDKSAERIYIPK